MDLDEETARFKVMLVVFVVFLVSMFLSWRELKYMTVGKEASAKLVRVYEYQDVGRRGRTREKIAVEYEFKDAELGVRTESDDIPSTATPPKGPTVRVQYLEGSEGSSRLAGRSQKIWLWVFFGTFAFLAYKFIALMRESKR